ncbi:hypothetical protein [Carboxydothermus ferrireducens]|uniref:Uncharacterized protein n=1 Tax=Carboxydothermus ferrireducens DSM 11255 TaxID=1119529 RepID=A0ABX2RAV3_9THEO|nr:hypothetical protein [Carboxydothermus ferrireducens]NYE58170.1 hypothetical protein [Carboxydothermus ferrireducens DSM 11255]
MFWYLYFLFNLLIIVVFLRPRKKISYLTGLITILLMFIVDYTAVKLRLYVFYGMPSFYNLPLFYLLNGFLLGIIFWGFKPRERWLWLYIPLISLLFTGVERLAEIFGVYRHLKWSYWYSFGLNIVALIVVTALKYYIDDVLFSK